MTNLAWLCAWAGWAICGVVAALILLDVQFANTGRKTISEWCLDTGSRHPFVPALLGLVVGLLIGTLVGHLYFPQKVGG